MTPAEAHVWIAVFAVQTDHRSFDGAVRCAEAAVTNMRAHAPEKLKELDEALRQGGDIPMNWPLVHEFDDGIRPAGKPDECFYCQRKVGQPHGLACVAVTKRVLLRVVALDESITGSWVLDVPYSFEPETIEFMKNEGTWCVSNIFDAEVEWDQSNAVEKLVVLESGGCLCGKLRITYVQVVDGTPKRKLQDSTPS